MPPVRIRLTTYGWNERWPYTLDVHVHLMGEPAANVGVMVTVALRISFDTGEAERSVVVITPFAMSTCDTYVPFVSVAAAGKPFAP